MEERRPQVLNTWGHVLNGCRFLNNSFKCNLSEVILDLIRIQIKHISDGWYINFGSDDD